MELEVRYIHSSQDEDLLRQAMEEIFYPIWPEYDPRNPENEATESVEGFMDMIKNPPKAYLPFVMVVGDNLDDPVKRDIQGFRYAVYFVDSQSSIQVYLATKKECRGRGIGRAMVDFTRQGLQEMAADNGKELKTLLFEIHDPEKVSEEADSAMAPAKRKALFESWGAREVGKEQDVSLGYTQPYWEHGGSQIDNFMLMAYPVDGKYPEPDIIEDFLYDLYKNYAEMGDEEIENNPAFNTMMDNLYTMEQRLRMKDPQFSSNNLG
jgi:GNAT superfamily N-acetyltransferase